MEEAIQQFASQFLFEPKIENESALKKHDKFIVAGMGGSNLASGIIKTIDPYVDLLLHRDYGLPCVPDYFLQGALIICSSYSGNTEEAIDTFKRAHDRGLSVAVITTGGALLALAQKAGVPYVRMPSTGVQPRSALGLSMKAMLVLMGKHAELIEVTALANTLKPESLRDSGTTLAENLKGFVPVIYSSTRNITIAQNWKIKCNETGKIPAFYNVFPELNHNEMTGFDTDALQTSAAELPNERKKINDSFACVLLQDDADDPRIQRRMDVVADLYKKRGLPVETIYFVGNSPYEKVFAALITADWFALTTANLYGLEPQEVPMVEQFKKLIT